MAYSIVKAEKIKEQIRRKQATIIKNSKKLKSNPAHLVVGWTKESGIYPEQTTSSKIGGSPVKTEVRYVARVHEYGLGNQTEKGFTRLTMEEHGKEWTAYLQESIDHLQKAGMDIDAQWLLERVGERVKKDLQQTLIEIDLIETSRLLNSIIIKFPRRL